MEALNIGATIMLLLAFSGALFAHYATKSKKAKHN